MNNESPESLIDRRRSPAVDRAEAAVARYLVELTEAFHPRPRLVVAPAPAASPPAEQIFQILTSRSFSYMGRAHSLPYKARALASLQGDISLGRPARFYFDLGPGYHASLDPEAEGLVFSVGLAEFTALRQVRLFDLEVRAIYPPGVEFFLVIDNLCGHYTNDVPLARSLEYVVELRQLIKELHLEDIVSVLVESERFSTTEYESVLACIHPDHTAGAPTDEEIENIARFLGHTCNAAEAAERSHRYRCTGMTTETLLAKVVDGVRLTQRATDATLGFRSFPGGAQRIQVGELVVAIDSLERIRPVLLTSRNRITYDVRPLDARGVLPPVIPQISYVRLLPYPDRRQRRRA